MWPILLVVSNINDGHGGSVLAEARSILSQRFFQRPLLKYITRFLAKPCAECFGKAVCCVEVHSASTVYSQHDIVYWYNFTQQNHTTCSRVGTGCTGVMCVSAPSGGFTKGLRSTLSIHIDLRRALSLQGDAVNF